MLLAYHPDAEDWINVNNDLEKLLLELRDPGKRFARQVAPAAARMVLLMQSLHASLPRPRNSCDLFLVAHLIRTPGVARCGNARCPAGTQPEQADWHWRLGADHHARAGGARAAGKNVQRPQGGLRPDGRQGLLRGGQIRWCARSCLPQASSCVVLDETFSQACLCLSACRRLWHRPLSRASACGRGGIDWHSHVASWQMCQQCPKLTRKAGLRQGRACLALPVALPGSCIMSRATAYSGREGAGESVQTLLR